mgnify:CR=1 FL=1
MKKPRRKLLQHAAKKAEEEAGLKRLNRKSLKPSPNQTIVKAMMKMKRQKKFIWNMVIMMTKLKKSRKTKKR